MCSRQRAVSGLLRAIAEAGVSPPASKNDGCFPRSHDARGSMTVHVPSRVSDVSITGGPPPPTCCVTPTHGHVRAPCAGARRPQHRRSPWTTFQGIDVTPRQRRKFTPPAPSGGPRGYRSRPQGSGARARAVGSLGPPRAVPRCRGTSSETLSSLSSRAPIALDDLRTARVRSRWGSRPRRGARVDREGARETNARAQRAAASPTNGTPLLDGAPDDDDVEAGHIRIGSSSAPNVSEMTFGQLGPHGCARRAPLARGSRVVGFAHHSSCALAVQLANSCRPW
jgi:hypothetical protein